MSSGQSLRNGNSVEPGLPNTLRMPNARNRPKVACLTVRGVAEVLRGKVRDPCYATRTVFTSPIGRGRHEVPGEGVRFNDRPYPLTPALSPWEREHTSAWATSMLFTTSPC